MYRIVIVTLLGAWLMVGCSEGGNNASTDRPDCDDLKGSSKIMAMNCNR